MSQSSRHRVKPKAAPAPRPPGRGFPWKQIAAILCVALPPGACVLWAYWPTLEDMAERWIHDPQYSHGFLVPVFALVVLWSRRQLAPAAVPKPSWWGLLVLAAAVALRAYAAYTGQLYLDGPSLLPALAGVCLLGGGRATFRWMWPALAFLGFMLPLPYAVETALAMPLRDLATAMSTYTLQTLGLPAVAEGNVIFLDDIRLGVIDACSGLGMLMTFFALSTAVALVVDRRLVDRLVIVASAVPIAVLANVARITATGVAYQTVGAETANAVFHDLAGWLMMPLALALVWLELRILSAVLLENDLPRPIPLALTAGNQAVPDPRLSEEPSVPDASPSGGSGPRGERSKQATGGARAVSARKGC